jgi:hypothetical protein
MAAFTQNLQTIRRAKKSLDEPGPRIESGYRHGRGDVIDIRFSGCNHFTAGGTEVRAPGDASFRKGFLSHFAEAPDPLQSRPDARMDRRPLFSLFRLAIGLTLTCAYIG